MKKASPFVLLTLLLLFAFSCKKFLEVGPPVVQVENDEVFENDQTAMSAVAGLYTRLQINYNQITGGNVTKCAGLSADEFTGASADDNAYSDNNLLPTTSSLADGLWFLDYTYLFQANLIIEGLQKSKTIRADLKEQLTGEMLYIRSLLFFYLVNFYGDIPLVLTTNYRENEKMGRVPIAEVYEQLTKDLLQAEKNMSDGSTNLRPGKWAAAALLSRVYLYRGIWDEAEKEASEVINSGKYEIEQDLGKVFLMGSKETIFQMMRAASNTNEAGLFLPTSPTIVPRYVLTASLLGSFEPSDRRRSQWVNQNIISGKVYCYPYKYKAKTGTPTTENYIVQRLAEVYLIRAEARLKKGDQSGALDDLNLIRARAGLAPITSSSPGEIFDAIISERRIELFAEWGHRWFDIKRAGLVNQVMQLEKGSNWQPTDALYPIAQSLLSRNPFLVQNPGY